MVHIFLPNRFFFSGMVTANPGLCPFYPKVHERAKYCYVNEECKTDFNCQAHEKCCENPCGIKLCTDNIIPDPLDKIGECTATEYRVSKPPFFRENKST